MVGQLESDEDGIGLAFIALVQAACKNHVLYILVLVLVLVLTMVVVVGVMGLVVVEERWRRLGGVLSIPWVGGPLSSLLHFEHLHDFLTERCRSLKTFRSPHPSFHHFYTADPANLEHALKTNFHNYIKGRFVHDKHEEFLGNGIFSVDGIEWKQQRKTASYEFTSKTLKGLCELSFQGNAMRLAKYLLVEAVEKHKPVDMQDLFLRLTFDSFAKIGFGLDMCTLQKDPPLEQLEFVNAFDECNALIFTRYVDPLWKLKRWLGIMNEAQFVIHVATLNRILHNFIENRKREMKGIKEDAKLDLLSRFLELRRENPEEFTDQKIRDIIINFLIAGRDTTALTLSWFFYALAQNPTVEAKLVDELNQIESTSTMEENKSFTFEDQIKRFSEHLTYGNLNKLQYLQACLQETLRLYPPVPLDIRVAVEDDTFPDGTRLRKGDTMNISLYAMGRMEWLWGKDATKFKPERFMKEGVCQHESPFKLPAFLAGPRMCLGKEFALLQMKVTASILLRFFKFELVPNHEVKYRMMLTLHMSTSGLQMHVIPRF